MVMIRHPLSGTEYHRNGDGTVSVVKVTTGVSGTFDREGLWLHGERRTADAALCMWVADGDDAFTAQPVPDVPPPVALPVEPYTERRSA